MTPAEKYRPELQHPIPDRIKALPINRGYPVPFFVTWLDEGGVPVRPGQGEPDFRIVLEGKPENAARQGQCWVCGQKLGRFRAYVIGPMCAVNRTSAEPPSHVECAEWSARCCPFLARPYAKRRELEEGALEERSPGVALARNPGCAGVWVVERPPSIKYRDERGVLFDLGDPSRVTWWAQGREATFKEVDQSIQSGLPKLEALCGSERDLAELERLTECAYGYLPEQEVEVAG